MNELILERICKKIDNELNELEFAIKHNCHDLIMLRKSRIRLLYEICSFDDSNFVIHTMKLVESLIDIWHKQSMNE